MRFLSNLFSDEAIAKALGEDQPADPPGADEGLDDAVPDQPDPTLPTDWLDDHGA
jgi:hypothetical protein